VDDPYGILGVPRDASEDAIRAAWRRAARTLHPDHNPDDPAAAARFATARDAYELLRDTDRRGAYDRAHPPESPPPRRAGRPAGGPRPGAAKPRRARSGPLPRPSRAFDPAGDAVVERVIVGGAVAFGIMLGLMIGAEAGWRAWPIPAVVAVHRAWHRDDPARRGIANVGIGMAGAIIAGAILGYAHGVFGGR
jgi:hypothetical protein